MQARERPKPPKVSNSDQDRGMHRNVAMQMPPCMQPHMGMRMMRADAKTEWYVLPMQTWRRIAEDGGLDKNIDADNPLACIAILPCTFRPCVILYTPPSSPTRLTYSHPYLLTQCMPCCPQMLTCSPSQTIQIHVPLPPPLPSSTFGTIA